MRDGRDANCCALHSRYVVFEFYGTHFIYIFSLSCLKKTKSHPVVHNSPHEFFFLFFSFPGEPNCRETKYDAVATFGCSHSVKDGRAASDVDAGVDAPFFAIPFFSPDISFLCFTDVEWFMIRLFSSGEYLC